MRSRRPARNAARTESSRRINVARLGNVFGLLRQVLDDVVQELAVGVAAWPHRIGSVEVDLAEVLALQRFEDGLARLQLSFWFKNTFTYNFKYTIYKVPCSVRVSSASSRPFA